MRNVNRCDRYNVTKFYTNVVIFLTYFFILHFTTATFYHKTQISELNHLANKGDTGIETTTANVETTTNVEFENIENLVETFNIDIRKR